MEYQTGGYTVITGASSGIGRETAKAFGARGKNLIVTARRKERLEALREEILEAFPAVDVVVRAADLSVMENARRLYASLRDCRLETWINCAGFGSYGSVACEDLDRLDAMLRLNAGALTLLSALFVQDYKDVPGTQLINVSSCGGYTLVPDAVAYCATKFYVSAFTEGLARELRAAGAEMQVKVLAPAATRTEFGRVANRAETYDYDLAFGTYHTSRQAAELLLRLYDSRSIVGLVDRETFAFALHEPLLASAEASRHNQNMNG